MRKKKIIMLLLVSLFMSGLFIDGNSYAASSSINLSIVPGTEDRSINIAPTASGKFVASANTTAKVVSDHASGYVLTTTATPLSFEDTSTSPNTTYTISPLSSGTAINAATFGDESNTQYNNKWGYKPSQYYNGTSIVDNTTSNTQFFFPAPINTTQIIDSTNTVTPSSGTTYDIAIGARIAIDPNDPIAIGSYTSTFTFAVVGNLTPYSITYDQNTQDAVTNMPTPNPLIGNVDESTSSITLSSSVPERDGYSFKGWCSVVTSDDTCSGITYNPGGKGIDLDFPLDLTSSNNSYTIYAMWGIPLPTDACPANSICYASNSNDAVGSMDSISSTKITRYPTAGVQIYTDGDENTRITGNSTVILIAPNYSRAGYGFAGWSPDFDAMSTHEAAVAAGDLSMEPVIFGPNTTITTSTSGTGDADVSSHGFILYPVWIPSVGNIQNWSGCSSLTQAPVPASGNKATLSSMTALTDQRDNNVYTVAKLVDGNCWMTENLRLDAENTLGDVNKALAQGYGSYSGSGTNYGNFIGLANSETMDFGNVTTANSIYYSGTQSGSASININTSDYPAFRLPRYNNNNINRSLPASYNASGDTTYYHWYSYGNYYNWPAAMANTNYIVSYVDSEGAHTSLCPTGWHLPTGGNKRRIESDNKNESWNLVIRLNNNVLPANYNSTDNPYYDGATEGGSVDRLIRTFPNNFVYSGDLRSPGLTGRRGKGGFYWTSSAFFDEHAYQFYYRSTVVDPAAGGHYMYYGKSTRCLVNT